MKVEKERKVSVVMTTYNGERYIEKQLRSILFQTVQPQEIVICDDCSQDHTVDIICRAIEKHGAADKVRLIKNSRNLGYIQNFHKAIELASGDFLFLADQDDEWYPNKLERMLEVMLETEAEVICTNFDLIDANGEYITNLEQYKLEKRILMAVSGLTPITFNQLIFGNRVPGCTYCCTKRTAQAYLKIDSVSLPHDHQIMFVGSLLGKVYFLNEKTMGYRLHANNTIGIASKRTCNQFKLKKPNTKPTYVYFLDDMRRVLVVPHSWFYKLILYLRIPYLVTILKNKFQ